GAAALCHEHELGTWIFSPQPPKRTQFVAQNWMGARCSAFGTPYRKPRLFEINLAPTKIADFGGSKAVPVAYEEHRGVPMPVAHPASRLDDAVHFRRGEVLPAAVGRIGETGGGGALSRSAGFDIER